MLCTPQPHSASTQLCPSLRAEVPETQTAGEQRQRAEEPGWQHGADGGETAPSPGSARAGFGLVPSAPLAQVSWE